MKKDKSRSLTGLSILILLLISCTDTEKNQEKEINENSITKNVTSRNYYINAQNAYNDFFFDSTELTSYISKNNIPDSISRRLISFYNNRNYQFAWFSSVGPSEQARGFWNMYKYYITYDDDKVVDGKELIKNMDRWVADNDTVWNGMKTRLLKTELQLTERFVRFYLDNFEKGLIKRKELEKFIPYVKQDPLLLADSLLNKKHKDDRYYEDVNENYGKLKEYLARYMEIHKKGGWPVVTISSKELKNKSQSAALSTLKQRLYLSGDLNTLDTTASWNDSLTNAIKKFQLRHGYKATGGLTDQQLKDMNVPVTTRIEQLLINMGRTQWIVDQPKGKFIMVNIPEYILHVTENGNKVFEMAVVVGKEGHNTMIFTGNLNQVVFAPSWNIPYSIVKNEIAPAMAKDPGYLKKNNMEITGDKDDDMPSIKQLPGAKNALGKVKFLFPNSFDMYFHDTPSKSLFGKDKRAFSHGCIRLSEPVWMANYLLRDDAAWDSAAIHKAMNSSKEQFVKLKNPVPVLITYYTAWVDENGQLHFAEDIYDHDKALSSKLFAHLNVR